MTPNALCFGSDLPGAGAPCHVEVTAAGLSLWFSSDPLGTQAVTIPFSALSLGAGGFDHDQLVVKWGQEGIDRTLYLKDPALISAFRQSVPPELIAHLEQTARQVRRTRLSRRAYFAIAIGSLVGGIFLLWVGSDAMVQLVVDRIPIEWERTLGEAAQAQFLAAQSVIKGGPAVAAVEEITKRLSDQVPNNPYTFRITVVRSDIVNAFALPGGSVVVFTGLLKKAESPEEVAGVLGHELNHVLLRHGMARIVKTAGLVAVVSILVGEQPGGGLAKQLAVDLLTLKFSREQETEADLGGLRLLRRANIDPQGMITFFERLSENDQLQIEILSTHPMSGGRAGRLKAEAGSLPKGEPVPFTFDWKGVQAAL